MFGASGKPSRGGRGGAGKRNLHSNNHSASLNRPSGGRPSDGPRNNRNTTAPVSPAAVAAEESFSLVTGNRLDFAMVIRLTPELVDEIKSVESKGGSARIRFDANGNNPSGNVIDVGGKDFRFTWSKEMEDLCDIYEESRSGEDGNGLLVESGCAWRKLNVQRVLNETTTNRVKKLSEEAERKSKSRKAIILDHGNPLLQNQVKAFAAAEANSWKTHYKPKKEPPYKKRKSEPPPGPPAHKHGFSLAASKGRTSASSLPSTPEQPHTSTSPSKPGSLSRGYPSVEDNMSTLAACKDKASSSEKATPIRVATTASPDKPAHKGDMGFKPTDLMNMLISLLTENPRGMSLKALEISVGEYFPNSRRQIESIIGKVATYLPPRGYILKSQVELESLKKPASETESSAQINQQQTPGPDDACDPENSASMKSHTQNDEPVNMTSEPGEVLTVNEKNNFSLHSPDHNAEKENSDNSEGPAATSSDSRSDSDSESDSSDSESDSGSHSSARSRSKSRSPVGSGSSSDSDSDASSNSKEGSDEEVDIMTSDDDKEPKDKVRAPEPESSTSPIPWKPDGSVVQNVTDEKEDRQASEVVEITENSPGYAQVAETDALNGSLSNIEGEKHVQGIKPPLVNCSYTESSHKERNKTMSDGFRHEQSDRYPRKSEERLKRRTDEKNFDSYATHSKKVKAGTETQAHMSEDNNFFSGSPGKCSPGRLIERPNKSSNTEITDKAVKDRTDLALHGTSNHSNPGKAHSDSQLSGPVDISGRTKAPSIGDRVGKYAQNLGSSVKSSERNLQMPEGVPLQKDKFNREIQSEDGYNNEKRPPKIFREGAVDKNSTPNDSLNKKRGEFGGKKVGSLSNSHVGYPSKDSNKSDMDGSPVINGQGKILRREPSELELGEFRDLLPEETPGVKKQFNRKGSFKQSENRLTSFDYWNPDPTKGKPAGRAGLNSVKPSPPNSDFGIVGNEGSSKRRSPEKYEDSTKNQHRVVQPPPQLPRVNQAEIGSRLTNLADVNIKSRLNEAVPSQGIDLEGYGDTQRKVPVVTAQLHDAVRGRPLSTNISKKRKTDISSELSNRCKDPRLMDSHAGGEKKRGSFSDDNDFLYSKYEKDKPERKGPIKDHAQYAEYVQEYQEKYDSYSSINRILESERNKFQNFGRDLEAAKERDMNTYHSIVEQLKETYRQCGTRHKRLKKVFVVLHKELENLKEMIKDYVNSCTKD